MSASYRITRVKCPCCHGLPEKKLFGFCMWCRDSHSVSADDAQRYAAQLWMIAGGGYINGDHDLPDMRRMEAEADRIMALLQRPKPWAQIGAV